jgi:Predicted membrane protein/domain
MSASEGAINRGLERTQRFEVRTPEGVAFSYRLASPVLRVCAWLIDWMVVAATWSLLATLIGVLNIISADIAGMVATIGYFLLSQGYRIATEWGWRGQTLGKRVMRLRVVDDRGLHLSFSQIVLRNLLRFVDSMPAAYLVGGLAALFSRKAQRLGDIAAGTLVIWVPEEVTPELATVQSGKYNSLRAHLPVVARLRQTVTPAEARIAWQALARRDQMEDAARIRLFAELAAHFKGLTPMPVDVTEGVSDEQFIRNVLDVLYRSER